jgi:hypothetical protein
VAFVATWFVGIWQSSAAECDGVCFDQFPLIGALALCLGLVTAIACGFVAAAIVESHFGNASSPSLSG